VAEKFAQQGFEPFITSPEESRKFLANEVQRYARLIKARGHHRRVARARPMR
jgi:tripartite-type tricarboxylate transporter receptor subunit TctC